MCANIYKSLSNDILNLYLKTKSNKIEKVYLECVANANASFQEFLDLFLAIPDNSKMVNPATVSALQSLFAVKNDVGNSPELFALSQYFIKNPYKMESLPTIKALRELFNSGVGSNVLNDFAQIFYAAQSVIPRDASGSEIKSSVGNDILSKDLYLLENEYQKFLSTGQISNAPVKKNKPQEAYQDDSVSGGINTMFDDISSISTKKKKETKHEKLLNTIRYCIATFVDEFHSSAVAANRQDLIPYLTNEMASDPRIAIQIFPGLNNSRAIMQDVPHVLKDINKRLQNGTPEEIHDMIRSRALLFSQSISDQDFYTHMMNSVSDLSGIMGGSKDRIKPLQVSPYGVLNSSFAFYVSLVLFQLIAKSK